MSAGTLFPFDLVLTLIHRARPRKKFFSCRDSCSYVILEWLMHHLVKYYKQPFLPHQLKDFCIHCEKYNVVRTIISIQIDNKLQQGPVCEKCYSSQIQANTINNSLWEPQGFIFQVTYGPSIIAIFYILVKN